MVRTLMFGGLFGKLLAVVREAVSAALFGTGVVASAYRVSQSAFLIPLQGLMSEALTSGFTPVYARERQNSAASADALLGVMQIILVACSIVIAAALDIFAQNWVELLAPGFDKHETLLATRMVQIMGLAMPVYAITALYAAAELAAGRPAMAALRATVQSAGLVMGTVAAWALHRPLLIPAGFCLAYTVLTFWGIRSALANGIKIRPRRAHWSEARTPMVKVWGAYRILLAIPLLMQVHFVVERRVASVVNSRALVALDYARFISDTAILLLATPFALAGLATMAVQSDADFDASVRKALRMLAIVGLPISAGLAVHGHWLVQVIYARGAFDAESVEVTTSILRTLALGIWAQLIGYAGSRFLSARGRYRRVMEIYAIAIVVNIGLNLLLGPRLGPAALGIASAASSVILGVAILFELGSLKHLSADLITLLSISIAYAASWLIFLPEVIVERIWAPPLFFVGFWSAAFVLVRPLRRSMFDALRFARQ